VALLELSELAIEGNCPALVGPVATRGSHARS
jgi:hypothetical protein